jgi:hypothetical protein
LSAVDDIRMKIERRLADLDEELASLRGALGALDTEHAGEDPGTPAVAAAALGAADPERAPRRPRTRSRAGAGSRPRGRRTAGAPPARVSPDPELERLLAETGGASAVELAKQTGTDPAEVLARIRELERAGRVRDDG